MGAAEVSTIPLGRLVTLEAWATRKYGDAAPGVDTLRRWAREARITPRPVKHGRTYFVRPEAEYVPPYTPARVRRLVDRMNDDPAKTKKRA